MTSFTRIAVALFALLTPALASAQGYQMVYRPELRTMVLVPTPSKAAAILESRPDMIARHRAMAAAYRSNPNPRGLLSAADHCDRLVATLEKAERAQR